MYEMLVKFSPFAQRSCYSYTLGDSKSKLDVENFAFLVCSTTASYHNCSEDTILIKGGILY